MLIFINGSYCFPQKKKKKKKMGLSYAHKYISGSYYVTDIRCFF